MPNASTKNWHTKHFQMLAGAVPFQIFQNPDKTHIFNHTVCIWGLTDREHMYRQKYRQLLLLFYGTIALVSALQLYCAHETHTDKMPISASAGWWWRAALSTKKPNKSVSLLSWTEYAILQPADWCCCHVLCSFTIIAQTQGTFVNHKGRTDWLSSPGSGTNH